MPELDRRIAELHALRGELNQLVARAEALDPEDCDPGRTCGWAELSKTPIS